MTYKIHKHTLEENYVYKMLVKSHYTVITQGVQKTRPLPTVSQKRHQAFLKVQ